MYWKETGDLSVWKGIAQDAIVMMVMLSAIASGSSPDGGQMLASIVKIGFFLGVWFIVRCV